MQASIRSNLVASSDSRVEKIVLPGQTHNTLTMRQVFLDGEDPAHTIAKVIKQSFAHILHRRHHM